MGRRLGLIIGINQYQDPSFRPLSYAEIDAKAIAQWLVNARGGRWNPSDVHLLLGAQATRQMVETWLAQLCLQIAGPEDTLFVYFAGHGFLDEGRAEGHLALVDTVYQQPASGLPVAATMLQALGRSRAGAMICVFDYFQSGRMWGMQRTTPYDSRPLLGPTLLAALQQLPNRFLVCSCRGNEFAPEQSEQSIGVLAHRLLLGFCGGAASPGGEQITLQRLYTYLTSHLGEQQRPQLFGQGLGPLVLVGEEQPSSTTQASQGVARQMGAPLGAGGQGAPQAVQLAARIAQLSPQQPSMGNPTVEQQRQQQAAALLQQAQYLLQMQRPAEALILLDQVLQLAPTSSAALVLKGQLLGTAGRFAEAMLAVEQLLQQEPANPLGWSMRAALLANMGRYDEALQSVERSLALDPHNSETQTIKSTILVNMAVAQTEATAGQQAKESGGSAVRTQGGWLLLIGLALQALGLLLGLLGAFLAIKHPTLPTGVAMTLLGLGLAVLCVNAARGAYLYGFWRLLPTVVSSVLTAGPLAYVLLTSGGRQRLVLLVKDNPQAFAAIHFFGLWLGLAAAIPLILGLGSLVVGALRGVRRR